MSFSTFFRNLRKSLKYQFLTKTNKVHQKSISFGTFYGFFSRKKFFLKKFFFSKNGDFLPLFEFFTVKLYRNLYRIQWKSKKSIFPIVKVQKKFRKKITVLLGSQRSPIQNTQAKFKKSVILNTPTGEVVTNAMYATTGMFDLISPQEGHG